MSSRRKEPIIQFTAVVAAGLASITAAIVTSGLGVTSTLIGAGLTAMIVTAGSAIYKAYLQGTTGRILTLHTKFWMRASQQSTNHRPKADSLAEQSELLDNSVGRMRAALSWFSSLERVW